MNKIVKPIQIIYRQLKTDNVEIKKQFEKWTSLEKIKQYEKKGYFKYPTKQFKQYYEKYKQFFYRNKINPGYIQNKKKRLEYYETKLQKQPNLLIEYIIPNQLLVLEFSNNIN
tara:strand:+ start:386 stop:724 length:339 start_codon:yes stop_codon:yes gene_type:complete